MEYKKADSRNPRMGLNNKLCKAPKYWCPIHEVWLSEEDVKRKGCRRKMSSDMMETRVCPSLAEKDYKEWLAKLYK